MAPREARRASRDVSALRGAKVVALVLRRRAGDRDEWESRRLRDAGRREVLTSFFNHLCSKRVSDSSTRNQVIKPTLNTLDP